MMGLIILKLKKKKKPKRFQVWADKSQFPDNLSSEKKARQEKKFKLGKRVFKKQRMPQEM